MKVGEVIRQPSLVPIPLSCPKPYNVCSICFRQPSGRWRHAGRPIHLSKRTVDHDFSGTYSKLEAQHLELASFNFLDLVNIEWNCQQSP